MAAKKALQPYHLLTAQSLAADFQSSATDVRYMDRMAYQVSWTGSAVGSLIVQGSLDGSTWVDLDINPIIMANATDKGIFDIQTTCIAYTRLAYTATSGTGSLEAYVAGKES